MFVDTKALIKEINEMSKAHALNYSGLLAALVEKGILTPEEIERGRCFAKPTIDAMFSGAARTNEEVMQDLKDALK
jgi:hypothetical protein